MNLIYDKYLVAHRYLASELVYIGNQKVTILTEIWETFFSPSHYRKIPVHLYFIFNTVSFIYIE